MTIGERIKKLREQLGLSQEELAKRAGYSSRSTINKIELGVNDISQSKVKVFAAALNTSVGYLMGDDEKEISNLFSNGYVSLRVIPIGASCGNGIINDDYPTKREMFPSELLKNKNANEYFLSHAKGVSMERVGIHDNDLLLFHEQPTLEDDEIGLFTYNGEEFIKRFKKFNGGIMLISESYDNSYAPIVVNKDDNFVIRAKLSKVIKDFD